MSRGGEEPVGRDAGPVGGDDEDPVEDRTVVASRLDETVVVARRAPSADELDRTVVSDRLGRTVVASRSRDAAAPSEPRGEKRDRWSRGDEPDRSRGDEPDDRAAGGSFRGTRSGAGSAPSTGRRTGKGLDPSRRIPAVPGDVPWASTPVPEPGVRPGLPVVYGARPPADGGPEEPDGIRRRLGPPPAAPASPLAAEQAPRPALPSLERRTRRRRVVTLACYTAAILVSGFGLWGVAVLAFG
ncbi:hypothetical protein JD276_00940 [Leucobacter sp. CSA1]|uniref:Uncharacterized protein n=1 Tax=Leucobacter chromiisoli TaxID=2796471 RepID=A0A934UTX4_9MICO|nr:hypothetical protein [Leucobacter chromiisoli]MBK0417603.1 hypothetical protein [Leucobacter chromiisoli]